MTRSTARRLPIGAEPARGGAHFRVWAPRCRAVDVVIEGPGPPSAAPLSPEPDGYFSGAVPGAAAGTLYRLRPDGGDLTPDPASRFQPEGPHGSSQVIDPGAFPWTDRGYRGPSSKGQVLYEIHVGTFTPEGTFAAAARELPELAATGITLVELMPLADFPGRFGWGYDGVNLFAPTRLYGRPDDLRALVDRAHSLGIGVILDVVYNHLGPDGNYLARFSDHYVSHRHTDWGAGLDFDGERSSGAREYFISNAGYWIDEFHVDGLRLDATQNIEDGSADHVLAAIGRRVREAARGKSTLIFAENDRQDARLVRPAARGGLGLDAVWNDDVHHSAAVALSGHNEAYYRGYRGSAQELCAAARWGYLYQGQHHAGFGRAVGTPALDLDPAQFVGYLENHDQVSNSARGARLGALGSAGVRRALTAWLLLSPGTPLLFQGQEFWASAPFVFFADHGRDLARAVKKGRGEFLAQFPSLAAAGIRENLPDPGDIATFSRCKLDHRERVTHAAAYALHRDLLAIRRGDPVIAAQRRPEGAVLSEAAFALRYLGDAGDDRLLLVNLGVDLALSPAPEPLLAPPAGGPWVTRWSSEDPRYEGGAVALDPGEIWRIPGRAAVLLGPG